MADLCVIYYCEMTLFFQLFKTDIEYLLSMEKLWQTRKPPVPLELDSLFTDQGTSGYSMHMCMQCMCPRPICPLRPKIL